MDFYIGQIVRLERGWTPMQIILISGGKIRAKYCGDSHYHGVTMEDFKNPMYADSCQTRAINQQYGFVPWDKPLLEKFTYNRAGYNKYLRLSGEANMKRQFLLRKVRAGVVNVIGTQVGETSDGKIILEFVDGRIEVHPMENLREFKQRAMRVRSVTTARDFYFYVDADAQLEVKDLIISDDGVIFSVVDPDFDYQRPPGQYFKGQKLVTESL